MIQVLDSESKPVIVASRDQLLSWVNDGGIAAGLNGAGYSHQRLTPKKIVSFKAPVSILENFDFELPETNFPLLIELYNSELCDRTFVAFEDVRAVHFRTETELVAFQRFPTPAFGMSEVLLLVSPELFEGNPEDESINVQQSEFDDLKYQKLESFAGSILFAIQARVTDEIGTLFVRSLISNEEIQLPPILQALADYRWARDTSSMPLSSFVSKILNFTFQNLSDYRAIDSESAAVEWSNRLLDLTVDFDSFATEGQKPPSERFRGMANILSSESALKELADSSNPFQVMQYAILIALMRRDPKSFLHWTSTARGNCEEVRLAAAFLLGIRCSRPLILERKIRTEELEKALARAISESMLDNESTTLGSISSSVVAPLNQVRSKKDDPKKPTENSSALAETSVVISGTYLIGIELENLLNGNFVIKIRAATAEASNSNSSASAGSGETSLTKAARAAATSKAKKPEATSASRPKSPSSASSTGRKKVGGYADPSVTLFDVADNNAEGESQ